MRLQNKNQQTPLLLKIQRVFFLSLFVVFMAGSFVHAEEILREGLFKAEVLRVIDGDTIRLKSGRVVRYIGIDSPELKQKVDDLWVYHPEPFAEEAAKFNKELVEGKEVLIEIDPVKRNDKYGRTLAHVYIDKVLVSEELLKRGLAKTKTPSLQMKHRLRFWSLEEMAWMDKRGLWASEERTP